MRIEKGDSADRDPERTGAGTCVGEMSLLLGSNATADVVASERSVVAVIENAASMIEEKAGLAVVPARLLCGCACT